MQSTERSDGMCRSVFRHEEPSEIRQAFRQRWIELINRLEDAGGLRLCGRADEPCRL